MALRVTRLVAKLPLDRAAVFCCLALCGLLLAGCQTGGVSDGLARFTNSRATDLVLRFASWDCIFITKPRTREEGFQPIFNRQNVIPTVQRITNRRGLATVIFHADRQGDELSHDVREWMELLKAAGFQRVVILRAQFDSEQLDGSEILEDSQNQSAS